MELNQLEYFRALAHINHFTQAAESVSLSQPALSRSISKLEKEGSWEFGFAFPKKFAALVIEKGSICLNGISLTVFNVKKKTFNVAIIPYTFEHTNIRNINIGDQVNLEFDMIGKYLLRRLSLKD